MGKTPGVEGEFSRPAAVSPPYQAGKRSDPAARETHRPVMVAGSTQAARQCAATLTAAGVPVRRARNWTQILGHLEDEELGILILPPRLKGMGLLEGLRLVRKMNPILALLVLGPLPLESQGEVLRVGAEGVLPEDLPAPMLVDWVRSYEQRQRIRRENERLRTRILESEAYLARILDHLDEGIITTDCTGRVLAANQVARQLCRLPTPWRVLLSPGTVSIIWPKPLSGFWKQAPMKGASSSARRGSRLFPYISGAPSIAWKGGNWRPFWFSGTSPPRRNWRCGWKKASAWPRWARSPRAWPMKYAIP
jgi:hypothetical protein